MLCKEAVGDWKKIYEQNTGKHINFEEATQRANRMFRFLMTITNPYSSKKLKTMKGGVNDDKKTNG
jgi:hypothetical protein